MIISIIIPTRERANYLRESVQTAIQIPDPNIEIIVSDNASMDETKQVLTGISDPRVKHVNTVKRVSMRENFEFGMHNSSGDYVIFFGDDDGILPRQFKFLRRILEKERPDALSWNIPVFGWPFDWSAKEYKIGSLVFNKNKLFSGVRQIDCNAYRKHLLASNLKGITPIPTIYHGCVSKDYFKRIAAPDGTYFNGSSPDVYFWYRSILEGGKFIHVGHAFSLGGFSPASSGGASGRQAYDVVSSSRNESAYRFAAEYELDKVTDVIRPLYFLHPLGFFAILETVRVCFPKERQTPDYLAWYNYIVSEDSPWRDTVREILRDYAIKSGTLSEFEQAESEQRSGKSALKNPRKCCPASRKALSEMKEILRNYATRTPVLPQPKRFRLSAEIAQKNTILTAVNVYDSVLADDYEHILDGTGSRKAIWKQVVKRSRAYPVWRASTQEKDTT